MHPEIPAEIVNSKGERFRVVTRTPKETRTTIYDVAVYSMTGERVARLHMGPRAMGWYLDELHVFFGKRCGLGSELLRIAESCGRQLGFEEIHGKAIDHQGTGRDWLLDWYRSKGYQITILTGDQREDYLGDIKKKL